MREAGAKGGDSWWRSRFEQAPPQPRPVLGGGDGSGRTPRLERVRRWAFIAVLAWSPLPLGSERPWAWSLLGVLVALLLVAFAAVSLAGAREPVSLRQLRLPLLLGAVLAAWILFQSLPANPLGWHHPLWDKASEVLGEKLSASLSIDRAASWVHLFRLLTYGGFFLLAWQIGQRAEGAALVVRAAAAMGAVYAVYGIVEFASPHPAILWMRKWAYVHDVTSTFVNRNSFATFAGLTTLAGLALVADSLVKRTDARSATTLLLSTIDTILWRGKGAVIAVAFTGPALLLSHSQAGMFATLCGVAALGAAVWAAPSLRLPGRRIFIWFLMAAAIVGVVIAGAATLQRMVDTALGPEDARGAIYSDTLAAIDDNALGGTGLGSFQFIYPMYQSIYIEGVIDRGHNDYLENMLELGVPAALLLFALIGWLARDCALGVLRRRKDALYPCLGIAATALVSVHSLFDFSLQIPAVAALYASLLGVGVAQSVSSRGADERRHLGRS